DMPYHRMSIFEVGSDKRGATRAFDYAEPVPFHKVQIKLQWDFRTDGAFWLSHGTVVFPCKNLTAQNAGDCLKGMFWVHADTPVGDTLDPGTGLHGSQLASSHTFVNVRHLDGSVSTPPLPVHWLWYDMKWLPRWPDFAPVLLGRDVLRYTPLDENLRDVVVSERAQAELGDTGLRWLPAVESGPSVGGGAPAAVALDKAQTSIRSAVFADKAGQALVTADEAGVAGVRQVTRQAASSAVTFAAAAPPGSERATSLYSRFLGAVLVLGGPETDPGVVWRSASPTDNHWTALRLSTPLGHVLAATVSSADGKVYLLDEISDGRQAVGRLARLDPASGALELLGQWPRRYGYGRLALGLDEDGSILLTAASADAHVVLHLSAGGRAVRVLGRYDGRGAPIHPVFPTRDGYVLHFDDGKQQTSQRLDTVDVITDLSLDEVGRVL
ncbi:MAG TPA: hypothetical protein VFT22_21300, partial [Kofleriaceae bacterium]|nr:hypothetical protein [Kofleriaceae bacterium]